MRDYYSNQRNRLQNVSETEASNGKIITFVNDNYFTNRFQDFVYSQLLVFQKLTFSKLSVSMTGTAPITICC